MISLARRHILSRVSTLASSRLEVRAIFQHCIYGQDIGRQNWIRVTLIKLLSLRAPANIVLQLLGVIITNNLNWEAHVSAIYAKASKRLHFLKLLKRSSMPTEDLLQYYKAIIRSVIDFASPVWQSSLTTDQRHQLELIQRRALRIISGSPDYELYCVLYDIDPISVRLDNLARSMFQRLCRPDDCLHNIIPARCQCDALTRLRNYHQFPDILCRTE